MIIVNFDHSKEIALKAFELAMAPGYEPQSKFKSDILTILESRLKTYKYIFVNALIAKASDQSINPICLQVKSELAGAYNARDHCHEVLVPFEREYLNGALGNSNEPFLSNPARVPELRLKESGSNNVVLTLLCNILPQINNYSLAFEALTDSIYYAINLNQNHNKQLLQSYNILPSYIITNFLNQILRESHGGQTLVVAIASLMKAYTTNLNGSFSVKPHKITQPGTSSKEISDIDIFLDEKIMYTIEAKDKIFNEYDVQHAVQKSQSSGAKNIFFVTGPRGIYEGRTPINALQQVAHEEGIHLIIIKYFNFIDMILGLTIWDDNNEDFMKFVKEVFNDAYISTETKQYVLEEAKEYIITTE